MPLVNHSFGGYQHNFFNGLWLLVLLVCLFCALVVAEYSLISVCSWRNLITTTSGRSLEHASSQDTSATWCSTVAVELFRCVSICHCVRLFFWSCRTLIREKRQHCSLIREKRARGCRDMYVGHAYNINWFQFCTKPITVLCYVQCESKKSPPRFSDIFPYDWEFLINFTHLLYVTIYIRLQIFI